MKKFLMMICVITLALPAFADNSETIKYMNQSQGFSGFNRELPKQESYMNFQRNTKITAPSRINDEYSDYDEYGYRIEEDIKPAKPSEKKVIKTAKDANGQVKTPSSNAPMTYDKFPQNYGNGDSMMIQRMNMPMSGGMF